MNKIKDSFYYNEILKGKSIYVEKVEIKRGKK